MMHAPEMSPTLDDALRALDGASVNGVMSAAQLAAVRGFLEQLDQVRDVPAVVLDRAQAEAMEGAYQAGVRCADESGHVLVVGLPAFLELCPPPRPTRWARLREWFAGPVPPTSCNYQCNSGRACTCAPSAAPAASSPRCTFPECVCSFERMVAGCQSHRKGEKQNG